MKSTFSAWVDVKSSQVKQGRRDLQQNAESLHRLLSKHCQKYQNN